MVAWVKDEPAASTVDALLQEADSGTVELCMSWINVAETFYILAKARQPVRRRGIPDPLAISSDSGHAAR